MPAYDPTQDKIIKLVGTIPCGDGEEIRVEVRAYGKSPPRVAITRVELATDDTAEGSRSLGKIPVEHAQAVAKLLAQVTP